MIRKLTVVLMLVLSLLSFSASAQSSVYTPGETAAQHFADAFADGRMIMSDIQVQINADPSAMNVEAAQREAFDALMQTLSRSTFTLGVGRIEDGLRLELGAAYSERSSLAADAALNITKEGLLLETSLLEGESISIGWETLFTLCGLGEKEIQMLMIPIQMGPEAAFAQLIASTEQMLKSARPYLDLAAQSLAPYGETIAAFVGTLSVETTQNVTSNGYYPDAAEQIVVSITEKDLGRLLTSLADQLENDALLSPLLTSLLAQQSEIPIASTQELCAIVREEAGALTDDSYPVQLYTGLDINGNPLYVSLIQENAENQSLTAEIILGPDNTDDSGLLMINLYTADAQQNIDTGFGLTVDYNADPLDPSIHNHTVQFSLYEGGLLVISCEFAASSAPSDDGELKGYNGSQMLSMSFDDGYDTLSLVFTGDTVNEQTAGGGEHMRLDGSVDLYAAGMRVPSTFINDFVYTPTPEGPTAVYTEEASIPQAGIDKTLEVYTLYTKPYDPAQTAALQLTQLETASEEDLTALLSRLETSVRAFAEALSEKLPAQAIQLIGESF